MYRVYLSRRVLITLDTIQRLLCSIEDERGGVVPAEQCVSVSTAQVNVSKEGKLAYKKPWPRLITGFSAAAAASFTMDLQNPRISPNPSPRAVQEQSYQTSFRCDATLLAGLI